MDAAISGGVDTTVRLHHISTTLDEVRRHAVEASRRGPGLTRLFAQVLGSHDLPVKCVEHNTATGLVVSGGWDSTLRLWDPRSPDGPARCVGNLPLPGRVYAMATSNKRLVVATADKRIQIYDLRSLRAGAAPLQQRESPLKYQIRTLRCMPDGRGYAASSVEGRVALDFFDDAESTASRYAFKCHRRTEAGKETVYPVNALGASPSWMPLLRASCPRAHPPAAHAAFHPVHGTFATGGCDGYVNMWDGVAKKRLFVLPKFPSSIAALSFNHDGTLLVRLRRLVMLHHANARAHAHARRPLHRHTPTKRARRTTRPTRCTCAA